jgi:hypothetical protein
MMFAQSARGGRGHRDAGVSGSNRLARPFGERAVSRAFSHARIAAVSHRL